MRLIALNFRIRWFSYLHFICHRINWEMCCTGFDKRWPSYVGCFGVLYLWLGVYGWSCKLMLVHFLKLFYLLEKVDVFSCLLICFYRSSLSWFFVLAKQYMWMKLWYHTFVWMEIVFHAFVTAINFKSKKTQWQSFGVFIAFTPIYRLAVPLFSKGNFFCEWHIHWILLLSL